MPSHPDKPAKMTCADFEGVFDSYVDETLDAAIAESARSHVSMCRCCDLEVTRWQQTRILLSTAVADFASAVDVSSVRGDVLSALGMAGAEAPVRHAGTMREAAHERGIDPRRQASSRARREATGSRRGRFSAALRFASAATVSAVTAAAAVMLLSPVPQAAAPTLASNAPAVTYQPSDFLHKAGSGAFGDIAPVAYTPPPLARPEVSRVEGIETGPGHLVSTWVQPRTNARVIWVQNRGLGAPIRTAGYER